MGLRLQLTELAVGSQASAQATVELREDRGVARGGFVQGEGDGQHVGLDGPWLVARDTDLHGVRSTS